MASLESRYYEFDGFWSPAIGVLGEADRKRGEEILRRVPGDTSSILDVGCGSGIFSNLAGERRSSALVVGLDRSMTALQYVRSSCLVGGIERLPFATGAFDCVTALEVLEHLPVDVFAAALTEISRVARRRVIVSVPNSQTLGEAQTECPACRTKFDPDLHLRSFRPAEMATLFKGGGLECTEVAELGRFDTYRGVGLVLEWIRRRSLEGMQSPLCPICGYENAKFLAAPVEQQRRGNKPRTLSNVKKLVKSVWPKRSCSRWILGVYDRIAAYQR